MIFAYTKNWLSPVNGPGGGTSGKDSAATLAAALLAFRRERAKILPRELFAEPAWDLLLELFVADAQGHRLTAREASERSEISPSIMSRWLKHLTKIGIIVGDGSGDLDDELTLSGGALDAIERLMLNAKSLNGAIGKLGLNR